MLSLLPLLNCGNYINITTIYQHMMYQQNYSRSWKKSYESKPRIKIDFSSDLFIKCGTNNQEKFQSFTARKIINLKKFPQSTQILSRKIINRNKRLGIQNFQMPMKWHYSKKQLYLKNIAQRVSAGSGLISASMNGLKLRDIKLLIYNPNSKIYAICRRQINFDFINIEPKQESFNLNTLEISNWPNIQFPRDVLFVINQVIKLHITRLR